MSGFDTKDAALIGERRAVVTGIGQSQVGRRLNLDPMALTLDACLAAHHHTPRRADG